MRQWIAVPAALSLLSSCLPPPAPQMTADRLAWVRDSSVHQPIFYVEDAESALAWNRAKIWIAAYSDYKLQTVDEALLETYTPSSRDIAVRYGYQATRLREPDGRWRFSVRRFTGNQFAGDLAHARMQALVHYMRTGQDCPGCGGGILGVDNRL